MYLSTYCTVNISVVLTDFKEKIEHVFCFELSETTFKNNKIMLHLFALYSLFRILCPFSGK